ncbi:sialidase family protein [Sphingobacterium bovistauri]|uniref:Exo-alpha-sialidase n=1 Tax=Sphingobacterium bovistauri TaxID=2781959 RepID=A0ABS7Z3E2_9SPHI|nr:sialidase family protein [Sphingobacterium bovistauri]MCA5004710.1 exo-alpha-sialidase [Sphingobacterium bovistauri]
MKNIILTLITCCLGVVFAQQNNFQKWRKGVIKDQFVYDSAPFPSCHSATIEDTPSGLVYAFFGGTHERNPDVEIYVSRNVDGKWTAPTSVADGIQKDGTRLPTWNPVLYQVPGGDLLLFYKVGPKPSEWWGVVKKSSDGGKSWSEPTLLPDGILGPIKNKPVLLSNGNLLSPSSTEGNGWNIHLEISADKGKTWRKTPSINRGDNINAIQPSVLDHGKGKLQLLARTRNWAIAESWSYDYGETWTPLQKTTLPNNNSGIDAVTLKDGIHVLIYNHVLPPPEHPKGKRTPLNVSVSKDGINWEAVLILEDSPISQYSYPAVIQSNDGLVHFAYTWRREKMKHVIANPKNFKKRTIKNGVWPAVKGYTLPTEKEYKPEEE